MGKELDEVVMMGDGVLVKKQLVQNKVGSIHLPEGMENHEILPMHECEVVKVGPGDGKPLDIEVGDIACLPRGPMYAQVVFDDQTYFIIAQHNILFLKRKKK